MSTCVTHSQTQTLKGTGSPCHYIFYLFEDGPLCRHRIRGKRVIFDNLFHFNFIKIGCNFFGITLIGDGVLSWVSWLNLFMENIDICLRKSSMRSGDMARICRDRLSIGNLQGHTPWVWLVREQPWPHITLEEKNGASCQCARIR